MGDFAQVEVPRPEAAGAFESVGTLSLRVHTRQDLLEAVVRNPDYFRWIQFDDPVTGAKLRRAVLEGGAVQVFRRSGDPGPNNRVESMSGCFAMLSDDKGGAVLEMRLSEAEYAKVLQTQAVQRFSERRGISAVLSWFGFGRRR